MVKIMVAAVVGLVLLTGCEPASQPVQRPITETFQRTEVTYIEGNTVPDVAPPTKLNVVLIPTGDPEQRCLDMGGFYSYGADNVHYCMDVDY